MATQIEVMRQEAMQAREAVRAERAKYGDDNLPSLEDVARLEALVNAEADLKDHLATIERGLAVQVAAEPRGTNRPPMRGGDAEPRVDRRSLGQRFIESDYGEWLKSAAPNGRFPEKGRFGNSPILSFQGFADLDRQAALITGDSSTSAGAFITADRFTELTTLGRRPLTVRDIIRNLQTGSDLIEYVRQTSRTNNAATVAEATAASGGSGVKPESDMAFEVVTAPVRTIANWTPITKQAAADVPQMRGIIDSELRDNLEETLETQIMQGDGVGVNMTGLFNTTGTQVQAWDTNILTTTRKARTLVRTVGRAVPTAYVIHPTQWESIDLLQDNEARYYYGGPANTGQPRLWGLPIVESEAMPSGYALVGDFRKAVLWDREQASIAVSDSHSDFFIRNLLAILAEMRAAFGVLKPSAFVEVDVTA